MAGIINRISFSCNGGAPTSFTIGLVDTNDIGINGILATIPSSFGTYSYSHSVSGGLVTSSLASNEANGCVATLFKDGIGYSNTSACCASIEPEDLISSDAGNVISEGTDGKLFYNGTGAIAPIPKTDVLTTVDGGNTVTLTFPPLSTRHITVFRNGIRDTGFTRVGSVLTFVPAFDNSGGAAFTEEIIVDYYTP